MAAEITATGTWTDLHTTVAAQADHNVPSGTLDPEDLRQVPSEITQFITLVATNYGVHWWVAAMWVKTWMTALYDGATANNPSSLAPAEAS